MLHKDQYYLQGLLSNDTSIIEEIYRKYSQKVYRYVLNNNGSESEAQDLFQDALISIYDRASSKNLELTCPFEAYLIMVCRSKWINILKSSKKKKETNLQESGYIYEEAVEITEETLLLEERMNFLQSKLKSLGVKCQELLKLSWSGLSMQNVAEKLGITYAYSRKKKSECIGKLSNLIKEDPNFNRLKNK